MPLAGAETKNRTFAQETPAQRSGLILPRRDTEWPLAFRRRQFLSRGYDYFFFFEVFFATFLVAAFTVFFAFFAFLAMLSSVKNCLGEYAHGVHRHAQHRDDITNAKLIPTRSEAAIESLAGGTPSRVPPSFHYGVAVTAPELGCLLDRSRDRSRSRVADAPAVASASAHRGLLAFAEILGRESGQMINDPARLIAPMRVRFMATDRAFARMRRAGQSPRDR
jgi:hypothetical protein